MLVALLYHRRLRAFVQGVSQTRALASLRLPIVQFEKRRHKLRVCSSDVRIRDSGWNPQNAKCSRVCGGGTNTSIAEALTLIAICGHKNPGPVL